jgi:hypothetical protein
MYKLKTRILAIELLFKELVKDVISNLLICDQNKVKFYNSFVRWKLDDVFLRLTFPSSESCLLSYSPYFATFRDTNFRLKVNRKCRNESSANKLLGKSESRHFGRYDVLQNNYCMYICMCVKLLHRED